MDGYGFVVPFESQRDEGIRFAIDAMKNGVSMYRLLRDSGDLEGGSFLVPAMAHKTDAINSPDHRRIMALVESWKGVTLLFDVLDGPLRADVLCLKIPRIGVCCGEGSHRSWLYFPPLFRDLDLPYDLLAEADLDLERLSDLDVLIVPGGDSVGILRAMGPSGWEAIKRYVAEGGAYLGMCAGGIIATRTQYHLSLLDCEASSWQLGSGAVTVRNESDGHPVFLGCPEEVEMVYNQGPFFGPMTRGRTLATYLSFNEGFQRRVPATDYEALVGSGAVVLSRYGEGEALSFATHPEHTSSPETHYLVFNALSYLTSMRVTLEIPYSPENLGTPIDICRSHIERYREHISSFRADRDNLVKPEYVNDMEADLVELEQEVSCLKRIKDSLASEMGSSEGVDGAALASLTQRINTYVDGLSEMSTTFRDLEEQFKKTIKYADKISGFAKVIPENEFDEDLYRKKLELMTNSLNERFVHTILMHEMNKKIIPRFTALLKKLEVKEI